MLEWEEDQVCFNTLHLPSCHYNCARYYLCPHISLPNQSKTIKKKQRAYPYLEHVLESRKCVLTIAFPKESIQITYFAHACLLYTYI